MILALILGCAGTLPDPLAQQRAALASLPAPAQGWAPQATLLVERAPLEHALQDTLNDLLARGLAPASTSTFGLTASLSPEAQVSEVHLAALSGCADCLQLSVGLTGRAVFALSNSTGSRSSELGFHGGLSGVLELSWDGERVLARPTGLDRWSATIAWDDLPAGFNQSASALFSETLRRQLLLTDLPPLPVVRLRGETPVPVTGVRVRPADGGIAVDFAFAVPTWGVATDPQGPVQGWVLTVPEQTALGMARAIALGRPYDPNARATPEFTSLHLDGSTFDLGIRAWPTRGRNRPRDLRVTGSLGLDEHGDLTLHAERGAWLHRSGDPPDLAVLLFGGGLMDGLVAAMSGSLPGARQQSVAGLDFSAKATRFEASGGALWISGDFQISGAPGRP